MESTKAKLFVLGDKPVKNPDPRPGVVAQAYKV
jgi:hypothetical protein